MGKKFREWGIEQSFLFPPSVRDFVPAEHVAHFVRDVVREELDLSGILSEYSEERGYPPYDPVMMTAVILYGYTQGVYSSRRISRSCEERLDYKAVSGMNTPDFRTVASFRQRHLEELGKLFKQVLELCCAAKIVKLGHVSLDGTRIKANASKNKGKRYDDIRGEQGRLEAEISRWFSEAQAVDALEDAEYGADKRGDEMPAWVSDAQERSKRLKAARQELEAKDKAAREARAEAERQGTKSRKAVKKLEQPQDSKRYNFTDPESEVMHSRHGFIQGYNAQTAVDSSHQVIVSCHVTNARNDIDELIPTLEQLESNLGRQPCELSADTGYLSEENLNALQDNNVRGYIALGINPAERKRKISPGTMVHKMSLRFRKAGKRTRYRFRKTLVEPVFGIIKAARGFNQFLLRGLSSTNAEWQMICMAHNLLKLAKARA